MEYQPRFLDTAILKERLSEMGRLGIRSIMYAGEGEPFLHKDMVKIAAFTKNAGIDTAITSNGVLFDKKIAEGILPDCVWIKISINAGTKKTYARIHRTKPEDFDKVIENMSFAAKIKREKKYKCTLGMQIVLLPENYSEAILLAQKAKDIGMDYLVVKPYSQHPLSKTTKYKNIKYFNYVNLAAKLEKLNSKGFNVIFRIQTMKKWDEAKRNYKHCLALPFWAYVDSGGDVWACSIYLTKERFRLGNIYQDKFQVIWQGQRRMRFLSWAEGKLDTNRCRINCRMDEINRYLWQLKHDAPGHVNFI
jgi:radical SAM protein with 4Fe4S-binding SPASM domain